MELYLAIDLILILFVLPIILVKKSIKKANGKVDSVVKDLQKKADEAPFYAFKEKYTDADTEADLEGELLRIGILEFIAKYLSEEIELVRLLQIINDFADPKIGEEEIHKKWRAIGPQSISAVIRRDPIRYFHKFLVSLTMAKMGKVYEEYAQCGIYTSDGALSIIRRHLSSSVNEFCLRYSEVLKENGVDERMLIVPMRSLMPGKHAVIDKAMDVSSESVIKYTQGDNYFFFYPTVCIKPYLSSVL